MKNSERGKETDAMIDALQAKRGGAPPGNDYNKKLSGPELRKEAYDQYCAHIASGKSKRSWVFKHPELTLPWETMEKYIKNENDFDPTQKKIAEAEGFGSWEEIVSKSAKGTNTKANVASLQMVMRNKFGWDKDESRGPSIVNHNIVVNNDLASGAKLSAASISDSFYSSPE